MAQVYPEAAANAPCKFCSEPVGYGNHEQYCPQNPVNLARPCARYHPVHSPCTGPGNHVTDHGYGWQCKWHNDLEILQIQLSYTTGAVARSEDNILQLERDLASERAKLPDLKADLVVRRQLLNDHKGRGM